MPDAPNERETLPTTKYEIMAHHLDINAIPPDTPVPLPAGWIPLQADRTGNDLVVVLYREV